MRATGDTEYDATQPPEQGGWVDRSVLEAVSWRLASELVRRHPRTTRIRHTHPGGGQYDCLTITTPNFHGGAIELNRHGTIQIRERFDEQPATSDPFTWDRYLRADPHQFLHHLEQTAGLRAPAQVPAVTPMTLTYRVLAMIAATATKSVRPIDIESGYFDSSDGGFPNRDLDLFPATPELLRHPRDEDLFGQPGYRFSIVRHAGGPILAIEQHEGLAWTRSRLGPVDLHAAYRSAGRSVLAVAAELLRDIR